MHKLMRIFLGLILVLAADAPRAADRGAIAIVSKDSVVFHIPVQDTEQVWEWNAAPRGTVEHQWLIRMPVGRQSGWPMEGNSYFAVVQESDGPPVVRGSVRELLAKSRLLAWVVRDGDGPPSVDENTETFIKPTYKDGAIRFALYQQTRVDRINRMRPANFTVQGVRAGGAEYKGPVVVSHLEDPREQLARTVSGPFTPDEYAIYQTVIDRAFNSGFNASKRYHADLDFFVLTPSTSSGPGPKEAQSIKILGAGEDTQRDYLARRFDGVDMASLAGIGYRVLDADTMYARQEKASQERQPWPHSVRVSVIGFNEPRDQALVYVETSTGNLGGEGAVIRLDKVDGEWLVTWRVGLWIA